MKELLMVGLGGFAGSISRYQVSTFATQLISTSKYPWGTFIANVTGCLLIGLIVGLIERISSYNAELRLLLITGFLGGYTTFSAFSVETLYLIRSGETFLAMLNVVLSVTLGLFATWIGLKIVA